MCNQVCQTTNGAGIRAASSWAFGTAQWSSFCTSDTLLFMVRTTIHKARDRDRVKSESVFLLNELPSSQANKTDLQPETGETAGGS